MNQRRVARRIFVALLAAARQMMKHRGEVASVAERAGERAGQYRGPLGEVLESLQALARMVKAWASRQYVEVERKTVITVVAGLLYFLLPIDAIPDFIPLAGMLDDVFVVSLVISRVSAELERFRLWEQGHRPGPMLLVR